MQLKITFFFTILSFCLISQVNDDFTDGNFTSNPLWIGDDSVFVITDDGGNLKLNSNKLLANSSFYLATGNTAVLNSQWEMNIRLAFNTSSANYVDVFLNADQSNLLNPTLNSYFVRLGGTSDEVSLFKKINGIETKIIDGVDASLNTSNNNLKLKVTCSANSEWSLYRDQTGVGNAYFLEGTVTDNSLLTGAFFGVGIRQSTASFFQKHFFDNVYVGPIVVDTEAPSIVFSNATSATSIDVLFSEPIEISSAENISNYNLLPNAVLVSAQRDATNLALVHLSCALNLENGTTYSLSVNNVEDLNGNQISTATSEFTYIVAENPEVGDIVINEFMADPSPAVGLPEIEFVEIYNRSSKYFNVNGWKLGDNSTQGTIGSAWLAPNAYLVLCPSASVSLFENAVGVTSFPGLNNSGDDISIVANNVILDKISYTDLWYGDEEKKNGGYTLERINPFKPCSGGENWKASAHLSGGTPGAENSVLSIVADTIAPTLLSSKVINSNSLQLTFSENCDSTALMNLVFTSSPSLSVFSKVVSSAFSNQLLLLFNESLQGSLVYTFSLSELSDCAGNSSLLSGEFALAELPISGDLVINELLFNPLTGGSDFVEIKNISTKLINVNGLSLANLSDGIPSSIKVINQDFILKKDQIVVFTADSSFLKANYPASVSGKFVQLTLPTYSNTEGNVLLLRDTILLDQVNYSEDWHFKLLDDPKGKSLERIDPAGNSNDAKNWHTAAESIGFASPGAENSQYLPGQDMGVFGFTSETFSPDQDGFQDVLQVNYEMTELGLLGSMNIYDERGRLVKNLIKSEVLGTKGNVIWDGINEQNTKASIGVYVLVFEAVDLEGGKVFTQKKTFVLAGKI